MSNVAANLKRDLNFLKEGQVPLEPSGLRVEKLDYSGNPKAPEENINDDNVRDLVESLQNN